MVFVQINFLRVTSYLHRGVGADNLILKFSIPEFTYLEKKYQAIHCTSKDAICLHVNNISRSPDVKTDKYCVI